MERARCAGPASLRLRGCEAAAIALVRPRCLDKRRPARLDFGLIVETIPSPA